MDTDLAYMTTRLRGKATDFLPFNKGNNKGAGNPTYPNGFNTAYLWEEVWQRDSLLDIIQNFLELVDLEDDKGRKTGEQELDISPLSPTRCRSASGSGCKDERGRPAVFSGTQRRERKEQHHCLALPSTGGPARRQETKGYLIPSSW